jgi:inner membrane protein
MPTVLTHPVVALALAPLFRVRLGARLLVAGALCTVLPDADTIVRHLGGHVEGALAHRGVTHSLLFAAGAAALVATLARGAWRHVPPRVAFVFLFACMASHGLLDMLTDGGPGIAWAWPFSDARAFAPWRPIEVSPLDAQRFFGPRGLAVLKNEVLWLWLPGLAIAIAGHALRRRGQRTDEAS